MESLFFFFNTMNTVSKKRLAYIPKYTIRTLPSGRAAQQSFAPYKSVCIEREVFRHEYDTYPKLTSNHTDRMPAISSEIVPIA